MIALISKQALPALIYGTETVKLNKITVNKLKFAFDGAWVKIFKVKTTENIKLCQYYYHELPLKYVLRLRRYTFLHNFVKIVD